MRKKKAMKKKKKEAHAREKKEKRRKRKVNHLPFSYQVSNFLFLWYTGYVAR